MPEETYSPQERGKNDPHDFFDSHAGPPQAKVDTGISFKQEDMVGLTSSLKSPDGQEGSIQTNPSETATRANLPGGNAVTFSISPKGTLEATATGPSGPGQFADKIGQMLGNLGKTHGIDTTSVQSILDSCQGPGMTPQSGSSDKTNGITDKSRQDTDKENGPIQGNNINAVIDDIAKNQVKNINKAAKGNKKNQEQPNNDASDQTNQEDKKQNTDKENDQQPNNGPVKGNNINEVIGDIAERQEKKVKDATEKKKKGKNKKNQEDKSEKEPKAETGDSPTQGADALSSGGGETAGMSSGAGGTGAAASGGTATAGAGAAGGGAAAGAGGTAALAGGGGMGVALAAGPAAPVAALLILAMELKRQEQQNQQNRSRDSGAESTGTNDPSPVSAPPPPAAPGM